MRKALLTVAMVLASGSAMASSIEVIRGNRAGNGSIISITCAACPPAHVKPRANEAAATLTPGTQRISIRDLNGKKQVVRTEAWLGGSPVTYVSSNPAWIPAEDAGTVLAEKPSTIDRQVTTSAVENIISQGTQIPVAADTSAHAPLDGLILRQSQ